MMHSTSRLPILAAVALGSFCFSSLASAETNYKVLNLKASIGSFKILGNDDPASGILDFNFNGTVLVSGLQSGSVTASGDVHLEYENTKFKKQVYHGRGKLVINGKFAAVQFFGGDLSGKFTGQGIVRMYGEFDKNLNTGDYWYDGGEHYDWGVSGVQITVPGSKPGERFIAKPKVKIQGKT